MWVRDTTVKVAQWLEATAQNLSRHLLTSKKTPKFVNLAPTSNASDAEIYCEAIQFAMDDPDVYNIAITGPYASGKSSVIKTFLAKYRSKRKGTVLTLSLASFQPSGDFAPNTKNKAGIETQEIERSILQQMLYGADANKLPLSRFKRIQTPKWYSWVAIVLIVVSLIVGALLFDRRAQILSGEFFSPLSFSNWFNYSISLVGFCSAVFLGHFLYLKSFGVSIKSISLKDVNLESSVLGSDSVLNRHLDEIIYFFQSTAYDLVVIEDLDRFHNYEIFVLLRELNGLVNSNSGVNRKVKFLYALRDDIFRNTDRTKFFEFIVPIVPIIHSTNSVDKMVEHEIGLELSVRPSKQFIREVARYIDDFRLIKNIFNEYIIYIDKIDRDNKLGIIQDKLLAIIIYKNVMPMDFAKLHRQKGFLAEVLSSRNLYVANMERDLRKEIGQIESELNLAEKQVPLDVAELRRSYAMAIIQHMPEGHSIIHYPGERVAINQLAQGSHLENIFQASAVKSQQPNYQPNSLNPREIEASVDPGKSFSDRLTEIEAKSQARKEEAARKIQSLRNQIKTLKLNSLSEILQEHSSIADDTFSRMDENADLLKFLVFDGYLDDTYYQYISLFPTVTLSPNDNRFLVQVRSFKQPDPNMQIDNAEDVVETLRETDFGREYVLNRYIVDYLLEKRNANAPRIASVTSYIVSNFDECDDFFEAYYAYGSQVRALTIEIVTKWPEVLLAAVGGQRAIAHLTRMVAYAPIARLTKTPFINEKIVQFLGDNIAGILQEGIEIDHDRWKRIGVQVRSLQSIAASTKLVEFLLLEGLFQINLENVRYLAMNVCGLADNRGFEVRNFTALRKLNNASLLGRLEQDFESYLANVLLQLEGNVEEDVDAIIDVLARRDIPFELRESFLARQKAVFKDIGDAPPEFFPMLFSGNMAAATWDNCLTFLASESYNSELLTAFLQEPRAFETLSKKPVPTGEGAIALSKFLYENVEFELGQYRAYAKLLPERSNGFPDVDWDRLRVLVEELKVPLTPENFAYLENGEDLQVTFVSLNFATYQDSEDSYPMSVKAKRNLLLASISDEEKLFVVAGIEVSDVSADPALATIVGELILRRQPGTLRFSSELMEAVISKSSPIGLQIDLLNAWHEKFDRDLVLQILSRLPAPYAHIAVSGKAPTLETNDRNARLATWLDRGNFISSVTRPVLGGIRLNSYRN